MPFSKHGYSPDVLCDITLETNVVQLVKQRQFI
jgi:hypothetical protein